MSALATCDWGTPALGWIRSDAAVPDKECYEAVMATAAKAKTDVDLQRFCSPVTDQNGMQSCVPSSLVGAVELHAIERRKWKGPLSRMFNYYAGRRSERGEKFDCGVGVLSCIRSLVNAGVCLESIWSYDNEHLFTKPNAKALADAKQRKLAYCKRVKTLDGMRRALSNGHPVVAGAMIYSDFAYGDTAKTGAGHLPGPKEYLLGGHMLCIVGYSDATKLFLVRNSWGRSWGKGGYCTMPYDYLAGTGVWLANDQYAITGGGAY